MRHCQRTLNNVAKSTGMMTDRAQMMNMWVPRFFGGYRLLLLLLPFSTTSKALIFLYCYHCYHCYYDIYILYACTVYELSTYARIRSMCVFTGKSGNSGNKYVFSMVCAFYGL